MARLAAAAAELPAALIVELLPLRWSWGRRGAALAAAAADGTQLVAGVGNIYASEALFHAGISPRRAANKLTGAQTEKLLHTIRKVLTEAIACGSTMPLNFGMGRSDGLFYFGQAAGTPDFYAERLCVYDLAGQPCIRCGSGIRRVVQAARSTFFCPRCQKN